ncbi:hypothetical protein AgCh_015911 [Apium graveolens]
MLQKWFRRHYLSLISGNSSKTFDASLGFMTPEDGRVAWQAPTYDRIKVNTDATIFSSLHRYSHAQVVRDHNGALFEAMSRCNPGIVSPDLAEATGIREALSWVKKEQKQDVIVETDCLAVVQWIRSSFVALSYLGRVINQCRELLLGLKNQNVMLRFVKRSANNVAHYLASYNSSLADRRWRKENIHQEFLSILCNDLIQ